jgi:hypothetical protein
MCYSDLQNCTFQDVEAIEQSAGMLTICGGK